MQNKPGVYLYLGYSRIDAEVLKQGRMKLDDEVSSSQVGVTFKDNTILVCRLAMWVICAFLRMVWGPGVGKGSVRASTQPDTTCRYSTTPYSVPKEFLLF